MVKKILVLMILVSFAVNGGTYGLPKYLWVSTWAQTHSGGQCNWNKLSYSLDHKNAFVQGISGYAVAKYPTISFRHHFDYTEDQSTSQNFLDSDGNGTSEILYFVGHGSTNSHQLLFQGDCGATIPFMVGGAYTKWVFLEACTVLYPDNAEYYRNWFNGAHAFFGFRSMYYQFKSSNWYNFWHNAIYSSNRWSYFWNYWANYNQPMWLAYKNAMNDSHDQASYGVDVATVFLCNYNLEGQPWYGGYETINSVYSDPVTFNQPGVDKIIYLHHVRGTPNYQ